MLGDLEIAALEPLHPVGQPTQAAGQADEYQGADDQGYQQGRHRGAERQMQDRALFHHLGDALPGATGEHDIEIAGGSVLPGDRRGGEDLAARGLAGIVTPERQRRGTVEEGPHRREVDGPAQHGLLRSIEGENPPLGIDQIDLDPGIDNHQRLEQLLEGRRVHRRADHQRLVRDDVLGEMPVQPLARLFDVQPADEYGQTDQHGPGERQQDQQSPDQPGVQAVGHVAVISANL